MGRKSVLKQAVLALGILLGAGAAYCTAQTEPPEVDAETLAATVETLAAKAEQAGAVRVVILARTARDPASECATPDGAGHCLARQLAEDGASVSEQLPGTAYVTAELTAEQLRAAMESGMIANIQEDAPQPMQ